VEQSCETRLFRLCQAHVFNRKKPGILIVIEFKLEKFIANGNLTANMPGREFSKLLNQKLSFTSLLKEAVEPSPDASFLKKVP
jgi:hypothetical protein